MHAPMFRFGSLRVGARLSRSLLPLILRYFYYSLTYTSPPFASFFCVDSFHFLLRLFCFPVYFFFYVITYLIIYFTAFGSIFCVISSTVLLLFVVLGSCFSWLWFRLSSVRIARLVHPRRSSALGLCLSCCCLSRFGSRWSGCVRCRLCVSLRRVLRPALLAWLAGISVSGLSCWGKTRVPLALRVSPLPCRLRRVAAPALSLRRLPSAFLASPSRPFDRAGGMASLLPLLSHSGCTFGHSTHVLLV
jgi:hypothetical protein